MASFETVQGSESERAKNRAQGAYAEQQWVNELSAKENHQDSVGLEGTAVPTSNIDTKMEAKAEAEAELVVLREKVALVKAKMAIDAASIRGLTNMMNGPDAGNNATETGKMVMQLNEAKSSFQVLEKQIAIDEPRLKQLEAQFKTAFPETLN